jgi:hypothetical protein
LSVASVTYIASNKKMTVNDDGDMIWNKAVMKARAFCDIAPYSLIGVNMALYLRRLSSSYLPL